MWYHGVVSLLFATSIAKIWCLTIRESLEVLAADGVSR